MNKIMNNISNNKLAFFIHNKRYWIAFGVFASYLCLGFYKIGNTNIWFDEMYSIDLAVHNDIYGIILNAIKADVNPPLYLIIVHYWLDLFGQSEVALRSISAIAVSLSCGIFFLFCHRFFNWQTAIFATLLFFSSNELFYYAQEGRTYGLVILFCVLSNYSFMSFVKQPNLKSTALLGIFNAIIFYLHLLASLNFIAQILLIPFLAFDKKLFTEKDPLVYSFFGFKLKQVGYYIFSWSIFGILFLPWRERFFGLMGQKSGSFWLGRPSVFELKNCLFDLYNSKELFFVYLISFSILLFAIIFIKRSRNDFFDYKLIIIPMVIGPFLLFLNYFVSIYATPIFLKRYVLFTILGFILSYAYVFSVIKLDFRIKLALFLVLVFFTARKMVIPRESISDFKEGVELLKKAEPKSYITTDMSAMYAYYLDRDHIFKEPIGPARDSLLMARGIYPQCNTYWANSIDFSKYTDIYYTKTLEDYYDPNRITASILHKKLIFIEDINIKGINISHFSVPVKKDSTVKTLCNNIKNDKEWYKLIIQKAKEKNITPDSMLVIEAIWCYEQKYAHKRLR
ncbi:MAG: glycosyltransferase family 39 protein [Bacteroidetes bacterium]|nr:glycosyltransferase family 39 protein [Bacteroidota bacterium]